MTVTDSQKKILIMAGGTGGHVFPALSIARCLQEQGAVVEWLGTQAGLEARVIPPTDIPFHTVSISGLRGKGLIRKLLGPVRIVRAMWQSARIMRRIAPDCVLGMGGFVTGPGGISAWLLGKPLVVHEQNAIAGFTNLMLLPFATVAMEAFPGAFARKRAMSGALMRTLLPGRNRTLQLVGNPVRREICEIPARENEGARDRMRILVMGGSLGAQAINLLIPQVLAAFAPETRPAVFHQCGDKLLEETLKAYRAAGFQLDREKEITVSAFIENMAQVYAWADVVICRAGALTVAELAVAGLASILVPYPYAVDDHQSENARFLVQNEAAQMIPQENLRLETLLPALKDLLANPGLLAMMAGRAKALGKPDADRVAAGLCLEVARD